MHCPICVKWSTPLFVCNQAPSDSPPPPPPPPPRESMSVHAVKFMLCIPTSSGVARAGQLAFKWPSTRSIRVCCSLFPTYCSKMENCCREGSCKALSSEQVSVTDLLIAAQPIPTPPFYQVQTLPFFTFDMQICWAHPTNCTFS